MERKMTIEEFNKLMQSKQEDTELVQMLRQVTKQATPEQIKFEGFESGGQSGWAGWGF
jgi:hypothetical protein